MPRFRNSVIALLLVFLVVGYGLATFNTFVSLEQGIEAQWAIVEVQYQRRHDLIPNLVNTAKGY
ncbi:MAG: LemA family protein, partial [Chlamydiia bacterium]|nr:LemA family protein [Chlamydiia bacterium]